MLGIEGWLGKDWDFFGLEHAEQKVLGRGALDSTALH